MLSFSRAHTQTEHSTTAGVFARLTVGPRLLIVGLVLLVLPAIVAADEALRLQLEQLSEQDKPVVAGVPLVSARVLHLFYCKRDFHLAWRSAAQVQQLKALADLSDEHGLDPSDFHIQEVDAVLAGQDLSTLSGKARIEAEILLSDSLLRSIHHYRYGKVDPNALRNSWSRDDAPDADSLVAKLEGALDAPDLELEVLSMARQPDFYTRLKTGFARYRAAAAAGGWQSIPAGPALVSGTNDSRVPLVRERLRATDDYQAAEPEPEDELHYDADLQQAVKVFQTRHSLAADGIVGPATLAAMNVSAEKRVEKIRINLERMRWVGNDLPEDYVLVDIVGQRVELYRDREPVWESRVIVGRPKRQTPVMRDEIEYLEFNPTWTVPPTILKEDLLPRARKNPGVVRKKGLEVINRRGRRVAPESVNWNVSAKNLRYRLRQPPGPRNALGRVKFMFPNGRAIYLHDTPSRSLFKRGRRLYSSGCVRVDRPFELAELLLDDPEWNQRRFKSLLRSKRPRTVHLKEPIPVILSYWTADADDKGLVRFRRDIYGRDAAVRAAMKGAGSVRVLYPEPPEPDLDLDFAEEPAPEPKVVPVQKPEPEVAPVQEPGPMTERMAGVEVAEHR